MDFELSDEQQFLREAARGALSRHKTVEAAREALDGGERLDLWSTGREAGWPGLVVSEARGGAGLGALDAMLVMAEAGRVLASVGLLGHVPATAILDATEDEEVLRSAWYLAQGLIAAESLGAVEACLEMSVAYAKERHTFGRPIGSYQAVKHGLVEILRRLENARSLMYYAGWARQDAPDEFSLAASSARVAAGGALDYAARENISVHGGIGATWEHDAPLYFRRAQLSRRLLGGTGGATDRVAGELLAQTSAA